MNLEEKAKDIANKTHASNSAKSILAYGIEKGYKLCKSEIIDFIKANPKASATQITDYLNSL